VEIELENFVGNSDFGFYDPDIPKVGVSMTLWQGSTYRSSLEESIDESPERLLEDEIHERLRIHAFSKPLHVDDMNAPFRKELDLFDILAKKRGIIMDPNPYLPDDVYGMCYQSHRLIEYNWNLYAPYAFGTLMHEYIHILRGDTKLRILHKPTEELVTQGVTWAALRTLGLHMFDAFSFSYCAFFARYIGFDKLFPAAELDKNFDMTYTYLMQDINAIPASEWQSERWEDYCGILYSGA
jgi:hypothetical protein